MIIPTLPLIQKDECVSIKTGGVLFALILIAPVLLALLPWGMGIVIATVIFTSLLVVPIGFAVARDQRFRRDLFKQALAGGVILLALFGLFSLIN